MWLHMHLHMKTRPMAPFWNFEPNTSTLPLRYPGSKYLRSQLEDSQTSPIMESRFSESEFTRRMLASVGSASGILVADACISIRGKISANGRKPFSELWGIMTAEGEWTSAWFLKSTHSLKEVKVPLEIFHQKQLWLATNYKDKFKSIWCCYVDDIPGDSTVSYVHPLGEYLPSINTWRLGLFHFIQRIVCSWRCSNPVLIAEYKRRLADCLTFVDHNDARQYKRTDRTFLRRNGRCRTRQYPIDVQVKKLDDLMNSLVQVVTDDTELYVSRDSYDDYIFQRNLIVNKFISHPLSEPYVDVTKKSKSSGKHLSKRYYSLANEVKLEAGWRELKCCLPIVGTAGPALAANVLLPTRMVEHNVRSNSLVSGSIDLGTADYSLVQNIRDLGARLNFNLNKYADEKHGVQPAGMSNLSYTCV
eukprot:SAG31_NODE_2905_length_4925_cov_85.303357_6_plen_418_part_00